MVMPTSFIARALLAALSGSAITQAVAVAVDRRRPADCQLLGSLDVQLDTNPTAVGLGWTSDGRAVVMQGLTAWRHDATGWTAFSTRSDYAYAAILALGNSAICYALPSDSTLESWSVWCLDEQGWQLIGLPNIGYCVRTALANGNGTVYLSCDGKLYGHPA